MASDKRIVVDCGFFHVFSKGFLATFEAVLYIYCICDDRYDSVVQVKVMQNEMSELWQRSTQVPFFEGQGAWVDQGEYSMEEYFSHGWVHSFFHRDDFHFCRSIQTRYRDI